MNRKKFIAYICALSVTASSMVSLPATPVSEAADVIYEADLLDGPVEIEIMDIAIEAGEEKMLPVYIHNNGTGFSEIVLDIELPEYWETRRVVSGDFEGTKSIRMTEKGRYELHFKSYDLVNATEDGVLFYVPLYVPDDIPSGTYMIRVSNVVGLCIDKTGHQTDLIDIRVRNSKYKITVNNPGDSRFPVMPPVTSAVTANTIVTSPVTTAAVSPVTSAEFVYPENLIAIEIRDNVIEAGERKLIPFYLHNNGKGFSALQFTIKVPDGFDIVPKSRNDFGGVVRIYEPSKGTYELQYSSYDGNNETEDGVILNLYVYADYNLKSGEYPIDISYDKGSYVDESTGRQVSLTDVYFINKNRKITVYNPDDILLGTTATTTSAIVTSPVTSASASNTVVTSPVTSALTSNTVVTSPVTSALTSNTVVTSPVTSALTSNTVITSPVTSAFTSNTVVTSPVSSAVTSNTVVTSPVTTSVPDVTTTQPVTSAGPVKPSAKSMHIGVGEIETLHIGEEYYFPITVFDLVNEISSLSFTLELPDGFVLNDFYSRINHGGVLNCEKSSEEGKYNFKFINSENDIALAAFMIGITVTDDAVPGEYEINLSNISGTFRDYYSEMDIFFTDDYADVTKSSFTLAEETPEAERIAISAQNVRGIGGAGVMMPVVASNTGNGFSALQFSYELPEEFELVKMSSGSGDLVLSKDGRLIQFTGRNQNNFTGEGTLGTLYIKVPEETPDGKYPVKFSEFTGTYSDKEAGKDVKLWNDAFKTTTGYIIVGDVPAETTPVTTTAAPVVTTAAATTTAKPSVTTVPATTTAKPAETTVSSTTTAKPAVTTVASTTTVKPAVTTAAATTTAKPAVTTAAATTTAKPAVTTVPATTTAKPVVTTVPATTTAKPAVTTAAATTTAKPAVTTVAATTTAKPVVTTVPATTTAKPVVTTVAATTTAKPAVTTVAATTTANPAVTTTMPVTTAPAASGKPGDADGNGVINTLDMVSIINSIVNGTAPANKENSDIDKDGIIGLTDLMLLRTILSK